MSITSPNLDDRNFEQLVTEALRRIKQTCPTWTDLGYGDPGRTLVEAFAYITDILLYRVNRLPEKSYIEFLRLIGVKLAPPSAASVTLRFSLSSPRDTDTSIPKGTKVTVQRTADTAPVFVTTEDAMIAANKDSVEVRALHCELIEGEKAGTGTGLPGQVVKVNHAPIIAPSGDDMDLIVAVEVEQDELEATDVAINFDEKVYRIWREVENFSNLESGRFVYVVDRLDGSIAFAQNVRLHPLKENDPVTLAEVPPRDREIRVWYRRGGGEHGNVQTNSLTVMKDQIPGVEVTNEMAATGGGDAETLENALIRGPQQLHSLHRAVSARDFELVSINASRAVNRAYAYTKAMHWSYAREGTVEVLVVPNIPGYDGSKALGLDQLQEQETEDTLDKIRQELNKRKPLGTRCLVNWAKYKMVVVSTKIVVYREEDPKAVEQRVLQRLWRTINPLQLVSDKKGWDFGRQLNVWDISKIISDEAGVSAVNYIRLKVIDAPQQAVNALCVDEFQPATWYAAADYQLFRTTNDAEGWELLRSFEDETITRLKSFPRDASALKRAGLIAVSTNLNSEKGKGSKVYVSENCGETWNVAIGTTFTIEDMAWVERDNKPVLLLATENGLFELESKPGSDPKKIIVNSSKQDLGFYAVAVSSDIWSGTTVAVAARGNEGVYLSINGGIAGSFEPIGLEKELIRELWFQRYGPYQYLWAGTHVIGNDPGNGCFRWRLTGVEENPEKWINYKDGWGRSGNCYAIASHESLVWAATDRLGVLTLDISKEDPKWVRPNTDCGLSLQPKADLGMLLPVKSVAASENCLLAGNERGIFRSTDKGKNYQLVSNSEYTEKVTLPRTWLFCSGKHEIEVLKESESE